MCASYATKSRNTDFEQHANKIFTAIKEIDPAYAEKRAIWELFQNALDITKDKGIIKISKTERGFKFEHNGRPFNDGNLTGLIKQSSNGKTYGSNENEIGQYGTGFLSTHVYGKKILINASVQTDNGQIKLLNDFLIDREADCPNCLNLKIQRQDELAAQICDGEENVIEYHLPFTSFEYLASNASKEYIDNMFMYIPNILPYIFSFNNKLDTVEVTFNTTTTYQRNEIKGNELDLLINNIPRKIFFLSDATKDIKIVLPQADLNFKHIPKLFLLYPLMETKSIGINFLINAREFKPNKERDYLFLKASNEELKADVALNELLLSTAFELIMKKIEEDSSIDFLAAVDIFFDENDAPYLKEKKLDLITAVKNLPRINIGEDKVALTSISYLHQDILNLENDILEDIYKIVSEFYPLPDYDEYIYLSNKINNWQVTDFKLLEYSDILKKISDKTNGLYSGVYNKEGYKTLIKTISADVELMNLEVIPNIHNEFKSHKELKRWNEIEQPLIQTMDAINYDISSTYLHPDFYFLTSVSNYTRETFKDDLNKFNNDKIAQLEKHEGEISRVDSVLFYSVLNALTYFIDLNSITETNKKYALFLKSIFELPGATESISTPSVVLNYDSSFKLLARLYVKSLSIQNSDYIKSSIERIKEFIEILDKAPELKKNLLDKLACFPNQMYNLKSQSVLKLDGVKDDDFKIKYFERTNYEIRKDLILSGFEGYLQHSDIITGVQLGDAIEKSLSSNKIFFPITKEQVDTLLPILLDLIQYIAKPDSKWTHWLPNLNSVKEEILMHKFQDEKTRASLFNILSEPEDKINILGQLAKIEDLAALIKAGQEKQKEEARYKKHKEHIRFIGIKIQDLIQKELDSSLAETIKIVESSTDQKLITREEQNGQDFIIYKSGDPIFYIEVKSRWDSDGIVALSKRQVECCAREKSNYAVITVNVADYKSRNKIVEDSISFTDLIKDIYVNRDLGQNFDQLIAENRQFESTPENTKLIEFRGHIPQDRIKSKGLNFDKFVTDLKSFLLN
jgi:hypothetical protein